MQTHIVIKGCWLGMSVLLAYNNWLSFCSVVPVEILLVCNFTFHLILLMLNIFYGGMKVRGALETLVSALSPVEYGKKSKNEVQPALMNSDLLSREVENISLILSLLVSSLLWNHCVWIVRVYNLLICALQTEEDFYVRYYTLQLLTALLTNSPNR